MLDPFVGAGSTLLACSMAGRRGAGVDLSQEYLDLYQEACEHLDLAPSNGLPRAMLDNLKISSAARIICLTLVLTDPPYGNMLSRKRSGERKKKTGDDSPTPFTNKQQRSWEYAS